MKKKNINYYNEFKKNEHILLKILLIILFIYIYFLILNKKFNKKKIGIISVLNLQNVGNIMIKYAIFIKLREYGFDPIIICRSNPHININFLERYIKLKIINNSFSELKEKDFDILMVNSDQTWTPLEKENFYDVAFLRFAENWTIPKFIYGASIGNTDWYHSKKVNKKGKLYLKNFTGISFRERNLVELSKKYLGIKSVSVIDPTLLIHKKYYLDIIKNYKKNFYFNEKIILVYQLDNNKIIKKFIHKAIEKLKYKIYEVHLNEIDYIENFLFGMNISQAVITDSFHGTIFSMIFNKPFISFVNFKRGEERFYSLKEKFKLGNRIIESDNYSKKNIRLLLEPLNLNQTLFNEYKKFSLDFLKNNLFI